MIKDVTEKEDFIYLYRMIRECNLIETPAYRVLEKCLSGEYQGLIGMEDEKIIGLCVFKNCGEMAFLVCVWCKNKLADFMPEFLEKLKEKGFKKFRASSYRDIEAYERLTKMKRLWTVYEGTL